MTEINELEKTDYNEFEKPKRRELVFISKEKFLDWFKDIKGLDYDIEMIRVKTNYQECPNCKGGMESYNLYPPTGCELWYLCPHCNYTISEKQHDSFAMIILRALNGGLKENKKE